MSSRRMASGRARLLATSLITAVFVFGAAACTGSGGGGGGGGGGGTPVTCAGGQSGNPDAPDLSVIDSNCDGIDGDAAKAIFVAPTGADTNAGTLKTAPKKTVTAALAAATATRNQVLVAAGTYLEASSLDLRSGIGIYGGYDSTFSARQVGLAFPATTIQAVGQGALASGDTNVTLQVVEVEGLTPTAPGALHLRHPHRRWVVGDTRQRRRRG